MTRLLVLRPEPGASRTIGAARAMGLDAIGAPLFTIEAVPWGPPRGSFDALMLTSANAVRWAGGGLAGVRQLPVYAVGEATAAAARSAGLDVIHVGAGGASDLLSAMRDRGVRDVLHLAGEVHRQASDPAIRIQRVVVYRSVPASRLPVSAEGCVVLVHSPEAGCLFANLITEMGTPRDRIAIAAISPAAAARMGEGWAAVAIAPQPTDAALLAIAAKLCEEGAQGFGEQR